jgi:hypothetical protein
MDVESGAPRQTKKFNFRENLPLISFCITVCAFLFQIIVLYPWHLELSAEFAKLAEKCQSSY